jgi:hypothetical protein
METNITKDVQALHKFNEIKELTTVHGDVVKVEVKEYIGASTTYYFMPGDSVIHEDDWEDYGEVDQWWSYKFEGDEEDMLDYYLGEASDVEVTRLLQVLALGDSGNQGLHHALFVVLSEFK